MPRSFRFAATVVALALILVSAASADGDPASDYLVSQDTFTPYQPPNPAASAALNAAVVAVWSHGDRVKVAVVASAEDLGAIPSIFGQPVAYARFLGAELRLVYTGPLLVAMPDGFGFVRNATSVEAAQAVLARTATGTDATSLTASAAVAVRTLEQGGFLHVKDVAAPKVSVQPEHAFRGRRVLLRYALNDDSHWARVDLSVQTGGGATIAAFHEPFQHASPTSGYGIVWRVPRTAPKQLALCIRATDHAGNRSRLVCAELSVG